MRSTITSLVQTTVVLHGAHYGDAVVVSPSGEIEVHSPGANGVYLSAG